MADFINTPNMDLAVPTIGVDAGPDYAIHINNDLTILDSHDHSPGFGVQITPDGLNINTDLTVNNNNLIDVRTLRFNPQLMAPIGVSDLGCLYELGTDLYYNDGAGNTIRITQSGGVAGTPGSIGGLVAPASATYVPASSSFVWRSASGIAANMDFGSAILRNLSPNSTFGLTLSPPANLSSNYTLTLPVLPTANNNFLTINTNGTIQSNLKLDGSTLNLSGTNVQVANAGISTAQLANASVTGIKIASNTISGTNIAPLTVQSSNIAAFPAVQSSTTTGAGSGATPFTIATATTTFTGGKNILLLALGANAAQLALTGGTGVVTFNIDGTPTNNYSISPGVFYPNFIGFVNGGNVTAGSHTITLTGISSTGQSINWTSISILAIETA